MLFDESGGGLAVVHPRWFALGWCSDERPMVSSPRRMQPPWGDDGGSRRNSQGHQAGGWESPAARGMLPRSEPCAGGGASVPTLGAKPHFLTLASIKTNPAWWPSERGIHLPAVPGVEHHPSAGTVTNT